MKKRLDPNSPSHVPFILISFFFFPFSGHRMFAHAFLTRPTALVVYPTESRRKEVRGEKFSPWGIFWVGKWKNIQTELLPSATENREKWNVKLFWRFFDWSISWREKINSISCAVWPEKWPEKPMQLRFDWKIVMGKTKICSSFAFVLWGLRPSKKTISSTQSDIFYSPSSHFESIILTDSPSTRLTWVMDEFFLRILHLFFIFSMHMTNNAVFSLPLLRLTDLVVFNATRRLKDGRRTKGKSADEADPNDRTRLSSPPRKRRRRNRRKEARFPIRLKLLSGFGYKSDRASPRG